MKKPRDEAIRVAIEALKFIEAADEPGASLTAYLALKEIDAILTQQDMRGSTQSQKSMT